METVNYETARRLKDCWFPQPIPNPGQTWYRKDGAQCFVKWVDEIGAMLHYLKDTGSVELELKAFEGLLYAPTAADILQQMPGADLRWNGSEFVCKYRGETFDTNPAECVAKMWNKVFGLDPETNKVIV